MKEKYIHIMEQALNCYTEKEIAEYLTATEENGYKEHGFPRLTANIGILLSFGKVPHLKDLFVRMMDACTLQMPAVSTAKYGGYGNDFSVFEVCNCLKAIKDADLFDKETVNTWYDRMRGFLPRQGYTARAKDKMTPIGNWAAFSGLSEIAREKILGVADTEFIETQIASQLLSVNASGLYKDPGNPVVYDLGPRVLFALMLKFGYDGESAKALSAILEKSADITAKMQSVTGEIPFGGRSNQMVFNEMEMASVMEYYADFYHRKGDTEKAGKAKAGAVLAVNRTMAYLNREVATHAKNAYDHDLKIGCEQYAYFNKYMITTASYAYFSYLLCNESILPTVSVAEKGGYVAQMDDDFHKLFLNAGDYFAEIELRADFHYDAGGLGRIHKKNCPSDICLSVPFPADEKQGYQTENKNSRPMSLCCYAENEGETLYGSERYAEYRVLKQEADEDIAKATVECVLSKDITAITEYTVTRSGVEISLSGAPEGGFMLPAFLFDGARETEIEEKDGSISIGYQGSTCVYTFDGEILDREVFYNRNGRYRVYKVKTDKVKIEMHEKGVRV